VKSKGYSSKLSGKKEASLFYFIVKPSGKERNKGLGLVAVDKNNTEIMISPLLRYGNGIF
jgi:hypothetical protein